MRGKTSAWFAAVSLIVGALGVTGAAKAEGEVRCSAWKAAGKPHTIELRTCAQAQTDEGQGDDDSKGSDASEDADDSRAGATYNVEIRSGHEGPVTLRAELVMANGTAEQVAVTLEPGVNNVGPCKACAAHADVKSFRVIEAKGAELPASAQAGSDALHKVASTTHMEVLARDLRLTDANAARLKRIASRYFAATRRQLVVTGGTRTPLRQAQLMYDKLKRGDDIIALYENKAAAVEVRDAHRDAAARKLGRKRTIKAMKDVIDAQVARGVYVSKHLLSGAVDVRSRDMSDELVQALKSAIKQEPGVRMMDERDGPEPHFHLTFPSPSPIPPADSGASLAAP